MLIYLGESTRVSTELSFHTHIGKLVLFSLKKKKSSLLPHLRRFEWKQKTFGLFCPATKSYLTVSLQCVALGSLVLYKGEDLNWVNRTQQEWMSGEHCFPTRHFSDLVVCTKRTPAWEELLFLWICFCNAGAFSFSILPTSEINF